VNAALVKTAAVISKAAVNLRLIVHSSSVGLGRLTRGFAWKSASCALAGSRLDGDTAVGRR
jgi:hypothetical protein